MGRRGENIRKRKDGRWEARILTHSSVDGKARYLYVYGKSYPEVKRKRNERLVLLEQKGAETVYSTASKPSDSAVSDTAVYGAGVPVIAVAGASAAEIVAHKTAFSGITASASDLLDRQMTFGQLLDQWLSYRQSVIRPSTYAVYTSLINRHIRPELGNILLAQLTADKLDNFLQNKLQTGRLDSQGGLSPKTVADIRSVLHLVLDYARSQNYLCGVNRPLFYPKTVRPTITILTLPEQHCLEKYLYLADNCFSAGILLTLYSGLRIGELCALQWKDIDFFNGTLSVSKTLIRIQNFQMRAENEDSSAGSFVSSKTKIIIQNPKTENSIRIIPLPRFILQYLQNFCTHEEDYVLTGSTRPMEARACLGRYKSLLRRAGLNDFTFHALRHTFATRCIENGFDIKSLSEILGHANVNITLQRYVHPSMEQKRRQMETLEQLSIHGQKNGTQS